MTTPATPGGDGVRRFNPAVRHIVGIGHVGNMVFAADGDWVRYSDHVKAIQSAATAERQRLASMASEEDREMISAFRNAGGPCTCPQHIFCEHEQRALRIQTTLLATLTARQRVAELEPLARLGLDALEASRDGNDFDGGDVQEKAEDYGVVVRVAVGPETYCGHECRCAEYEADYCYRDSEGTAAARRALAGPDAGKGVADAE